MRGWERTGSSSILPLPAPERDQGLDAHRFESSEHVNARTETPAGKGKPDVASGVAPYWDRSKKPLAILLFLLPFVLFYELSLVWIPSGSGRIDIVAYREIEKIFDLMFGLAGEGSMAIPGILLVVCLLAWHVMARNPWRLDGPTIPLMWVESILVAVPVVILGFLMPSSSSPAMDTVADAVGNNHVEGQGPLGLLSMAVGAGLYEELIFRWVLIALTHALLVDLLSFSNRIAIVIAVLLSSTLFMLAHQPDLSGAVFYFLAGVWFSALYLVRGFGIAAGGHIAYDVVWVTWNLM